MLRIDTNLANYPTTSAIKSGKIFSELVDLNFCGPESAHNGFKSMIRHNKFQAGELAIVTYLQAIAFNKPWVMLPITVLGRFQHHCIGYNSGIGEMKPRDIEGKNVGIRTYAQTTGLWVRGILQHEYGVDIQKVNWLTIDESHLSEYQDPANCQKLPVGSSLADLLFQGNISAAIMGMDMPNDQRIKSLIPDPHQAAEDWYKREKIIPINHVFVISSKLSEDRPDVVRDIYRMLAESRSEISLDSQKTLPMGYADLKHSLETAIEWSFEQKIIPRRLHVDELFSDLTANLFF